MPYQINTTMQNITDFLICDKFRYTKISEDTNVEYTTEIKQIDHNPYYIEFGDKSAKQYELVIGVKVSEDDNGEVYGYVYDNQLRFKLSAYSMPTIEKFSDHIRKECLALIDAMGCDLSKCYIWDLQLVAMLDKKDIEPKHVYKFLKNIHKDYTKTEQFLEHYDIYAERMYQTMKFIYLLIDGTTDMFRMDWEFPIGEHFLAFLTHDAKFNDFYEIAK